MVLSRGHPMSIPQEIAFIAAVLEPRPMAGASEMQRGAGQFTYLNLVTSTGRVPYR